MTPREEGFLLLSSHLGDPERKVLTVPQLRTLAQRVRTAEMAREDRELEAADLKALGYSPEMAQRIVTLLSQQALLGHYLRRGNQAGCQWLSRVSDRYPQILRHRLRDNSPGCLWAKGELSLLDTPAVALVGSRELLPENEAFARAVGLQAADQGFTLVSGNARGADRAAQQACLDHGGQVISVVADELDKYEIRENVLYLSEDGFEMPFSAQRALSRNRVIHSMGILTFVAQSNLGLGGTWDGTVKNLRFGWSPVFGLDDGSEAMTYLREMGATLIGIRELEDFGTLQAAQLGFFES